ncbi:MAG: hypothetical protein ACYC3I_27390 [Gemmataceae bacterium]
MVVDGVEKVYATGRKVTESVKKGLHLIRDLVLSKWNYRILPHDGCYKKCLARKLFRQRS